MSAGGPRRSRRGWACLGLGIDVREREGILGSVPSGEELQPPAVIALPGCPLRPPPPPSPPILVPERLGQSCCYCSKR